MKTDNKEREARATALRARLGEFTGSETWTRHYLNPAILYTDGAEFIATEGGAWWLLDKMAASQLQPPLSVEPWQAWTLKVIGAKGEITVTDGDGRTLHHEVLTFTDFPLDEFTLWLSENVIHLPSER